MYSIYYKGKEYEVSEELFLNVGLCMIQFKQASVIDKPILIESFQERCVPEILKSPDFDYSRLEDESLEGVIDTTPICEWKSSSITTRNTGINQGRFNKGLYYCIQTRALEAKRSHGFYHEEAQSQQSTI